MILVTRSVTKPYKNALAPNNFGNSSTNVRCSSYIITPISGVYDKLAATALALMILLASVNMAIFLERLGSTLRRVSHPHGHLLPPLLSVRATGYSEQGSMSRALPE